MKTIRLKTALFFLIAFTVLHACNGPQAEQKTDMTVAQTPDLDHVNVDLPQAPGYKTFYANCVVCHSPAYIENQPNLSHQAWGNIVAKMQKTFGAPVSDSAAAEIVEYLASIKGIQ